MSKAPTVPWPDAGLPRWGSAASWFRVEKAAKAKFSRDAALAQVKVAREAGEP